MGPSFLLVMREVEIGSTDRLPWELMHIMIGGTLRDKAHKDGLESDFLGIA